MQLSFASTAFLSAPMRVVTWLFTFKLTFFSLRTLMLLAVVSEGEDIRTRLPQSRHYALCSLIRRPQNRVSTRYHFHRVSVSP